MTDQNDFLAKISDNKPVRIFLPIEHSEERLRLHCVLQKTKAPHFTLLFKPAILPTQQIDVKSSVIINLDVKGQSFSLESNIVKILTSQSLEMIAQKTISHEQLREYFRVDCTVPILLKSIVPPEFENSKTSLKISGTTVDLSGSGLRASFSTEPPADTQVRIELALPTAEPTIVKVIASPVRISKLTEKLWDAAYQFDEIEEEDQDAIIGCCLVAQRQLLRLKVKVKSN